MMRHLLLAVLAVTAAAASDDDERALKLKTSRQLREILEAAHIEPPSSCAGSAGKGVACKEDMVRLALDYGALQKWEAQNPDKVKKAPKPEIKKNEEGEMIGAEEGTRRMFVSFDKDQSGTLDEEELLELTRATAGVDKGIDDEWTRNNYGSVDDDGDGALSPPEAKKFFRFIAQTIQMHQVREKAAASANTAHSGEGNMKIIDVMVETFDKDKNGKLSRDELSAGPWKDAKTGDGSPVLDSFPVYDLDGDGEMDKHEALSFYDFIMQNMGKGGRGGSVPSPAPKEEP